MNLFIDTNIFLDFYHFSNEDLDRLSDLKKLVETDKIHLFLPEQVIDEFARNRENKIYDSLKGLKSIRLNLSLPKLCEGYKEKQKIRDAIDRFNVNRKKLLEQIEVDIQKNNLKADILIDDIFLSSSIKKCETTKEIIERAKNRVDIGNPPGKSNSCGDAINWESLLVNVPNGQDLFLVAGDKDYSSRLYQAKLSSFLQREWKEKKSSRIVFYNSLIAFFKAHFPEVKITDEDVKNAKIEAFAASENFDTTRERLRILEKIGEFSNQQIYRIVEASLDNFQIYGAHQYSPEKIGQVLAKIVDSHEEALDEDMYFEFCTKFDVEF